MTDRIKLSEHFFLDELLVSDKAKELGIKNTPTFMHLKNMERYLVPGLEKVRELLGNEPMHVNSAYRNPAVNHAVGGTATSAHPQGYAADFTCHGLDPREIYRTLRTQVKLGVWRVDQLILESGRSVVHISFDPRNRGMCGHQPGAPGSKIDWTYA